MDLGLAGRGFLLTGASRGLGLATAQVMVDEGARVVIGARSYAGVQSAVSTLGGPPSAYGAVTDLAQAGAAETLVSDAARHLDQLDGALISVGRPAAGSILEVSEADLQSAVDAVLLGTIRVVRALVPSLAPGAVIGLVLSTAARQPKRRLGISGAIRPGLAMTAKALADELGPSGIRVLGLLPGSIRSDPHEHDASTAEARDRPAGTESIPLRRVGTPAEFGRVAAFMLSPAASFVTGVLVPVDGGSLRTL